jgi:hypothetical protein
MTLLPLPAKCPELKVMEKVWQFMRDNWLSNRVFRDHDDIVGLCCFYWNRLIEMPWRIGSDQWGWYKVFAAARTGQNQANVAAPETREIKQP